jgi:hypothetical protein
MQPAVARARTGWPGVECSGALFWKWPVLWVGVQCCTGVVGGKNPLLEPYWDVAASIALSW